jgi:hypothetical protein
VKNLIMMVLFLSACVRDTIPPPAPDAPLPRCADLGCSSALCVHCTTRCMDTECEVP